MTPTATISEIVNILTTGLVEFAKGIGTGISQAVTSMMYVTEGETTTLSPYFVAVLIFAAIGLVIGLTTLIFNWLGSL